MNRAGYLIFSPSFFFFFSHRYLTIIVQQSQQMNPVHDAGLMELPGYAEQLLQLLFAQMVEHPRVHHVGRETVGILSEPKVRQPFRTDPRVTQLSDARVSNETRMSMLLDC